MIKTMPLLFGGLIPFVAFCIPRSCAARRRRQSQRGW